MQKYSGDKYYKTMTSTDKILLALFDEGPLRAIQIQKLTKLNKTTVPSTLTKLRKSKLVDRLIGNKWAITEAGRQYVGSVSMPKFDYMDAKESTAEPEEKPVMKVLKWKLEQDQEEIESSSTELEPGKLPATPVAVESVPDKTSDSINWAREYIDLVHKLVDRISLEPSQKKAD